MGFALAAYMQHKQQTQYDITSLWQHKESRLLTLPALLLRVDFWRVGCLRVLFLRVGCLRVLFLRAFFLRVLFLGDFDLRALVLRVVFWRVVCLRGVCLRVTFVLLRVRGGDVPPLRAPANMGE